MTQEIKTVGATQSTTSYTWDDKGNLITKTVTGQVTVYGWNADNRLVEVKQGATQASAITVAKYSYDALGNRVQKTEVDKVTNYLTDSTFAYAQTVQESITQGTTTQAVNYVWGNGLIQQSRAGQNSYYHADGLGSTKALTDETGNGTDAYQYDAFGTMSNHTGTTQNSYRYTGEAFDDTSNLQYNRARWYDASVGRFIAQDTYDGKPYGPITLNKYVYANADPVDLNDPSGHAGNEKAMLGYAIEEELKPQYMGAHLDHTVAFGKKQAFNDPFIISLFFKPDIFDKSQRTFNEIKPLSPSGIYKGIVQMGWYTLAFIPDFYVPNFFWEPNPVVIGGTTYFVLNIDGILFYTDDEQLSKDVMGVALANLKSFVRNHASLRTTMSENAIYGALNAANQLSHTMAVLGTAMILGKLTVAALTKR